MALRRFMHPRNKYKDGADFRKLAELYSDFREHTKIDLSGKLRYNFKSEESLRMLTKTLLKHDYDLNVEIPDENLVPAMPLRLNYILWIEDLLKHAKFSDDEGIHGIDIGTGAVCIYPLLCAKTYGWKMTGTDISETSILAAKANVTRNNLDHLIKVVSVKHEESVLAEATTEFESYTFAMCNPPFFDDEIPKKVKRLPPRNAATGQTCELLVQGGERRFVERLMNESSSLKNRVKIYTTMIGHKTSCLFLRREFKKRNIVNSTWTEFCQGHTKRWGLAWTFLPKEVVDLAEAPVIRTHDLAAAKQVEGRSNGIVFPLGEKIASLDELVGLLKQWLQELKMETKELDLANEDFDGWTCRLKAPEDTWSHSRRKRRMARNQETPSKQPRLENSKSVVKIDDPADTKNDLTANDSSIVGSSEPHLECILSIGRVKNDKDDDAAVELVKMCMTLEKSQGGKHALETFKQYLINKLNIRDYVINHSTTAKKRRRKKKRGKNTSEKLSI